jgi:hypothetical protein
MVGVRGRHCDTAVERIVVHRVVAGEAVVNARV